MKIYMNIFKSFARGLFVGNKAYGIAVLDFIIALWKQVKKYSHSKNNVIAISHKNRWILILLLS